MAETTGGVGEGTPPRRVRLRVYPPGLTIGREAGLLAESILAGPDYWRIPRPAETIGSESWPRLQRFPEPDYWPRGRTIGECGSGGVASWPVPVGLTIGQSLCRDYWLGDYWLGLLAKTIGQSPGRTQAIGPVHLQVSLGLLALSESESETLASWLVWGSGDSPSRTQYWPVSSRP